MDIVNYFIERFDRIMNLTLQHFIIFFISTTITVIIGVAIGIFVTDENRKSIGKIVLSISGAAQSVPSIAVVALIFIFVGIGVFPAIIALIIYSMVPIIFNTTSGLLSVPPEMIEAARGIGLKKRQMLWKVKIPYSIPVIFAGIRTAATINIGTATIASVIGGGGLGDLIFEGLKLFKNDALFVGASLTALMAIMVDIILTIIEHKATSNGLKINK
jgi:osmoprotectant transport system permease protein